MLFGLKMAESTWQHMLLYKQDSKKVTFDVIAGHAGPSWAGWFSKLWANWSQLDNLTLVACVCICSGRVVLYIFNFHSFISRIQYLPIRKQFHRRYVRGEVTEGIFLPDKIDLHLWQFCFQGRRKVRRMEGNGSLHPSYKPLIFANAISDGLSC